MTARRAHLGGWLALLTAALLGAWLLRSRPDRVPPPSPRPPNERAPAAPRELPAAPAPWLEPKPAPRKASNVAPTITHAALDRTSLCPGESTLLRIDARDPDDDDLRYRASLVSPALGGPRFGFGRWPRISAPPHVGRYQVRAVVEDRARARDEVELELDVRACDTPPAFDASQLQMRHVELDAAVHEFDLRAASARARDAGETLEVIRWRFGDGSSGSGEITTRHAYRIDMGRRYSYYLVQADVKLDGRPATIEYGLSFYSYAAANLQAGYVALAADVERGDDAREDRISYVVTFSNVTPYSAWAREFELTCLNAAGVPSARWREPLDLTVPGESSLEQTFELDRQRCPGGASYELFGEADLGYAVGGLWSYKLRPSVSAGDVQRAREQARRALEVR